MKTKTTRLLRIEAEVLLKVPVSFEFEVRKDFDPDRDTLGISPEVEARALACSAGVLQKLLRNGALVSTEPQAEKFETEVYDWRVIS